MGEVHYDFYFVYSIDLLYPGSIPDYAKASPIYISGNLEKEGSVSKGVRIKIEQSCVFNCEGGSGGGTPSEFWPVVYDSFGGVDYAYGIATDSSDNIYVTGTSNNNYLTIKYDSNGNELWNKTYDGGGVDQAYGIATDSSGNVYVTGFSENTTTFIEDFLTVKYDSNGNEIWVKNYNGGCWDQSLAIATDCSGNVYVTGYASNDYFTIKYDSNGNELWNRSYDGGNVDNADAIKVVSSGNVYVTGFS